MLSAGQKTGSVNLHKNTAETHTQYPGGKDTDY